MITPSTVTTCIGAVENEEILLSAYLTRDKVDHLDSPASLSCTSNSTEVVLKPIEVTEENAYERTYLDRGEPLLIDVEKGAWFKIGVALQNPTGEDIVVGITVENVKVRIK